MQVHEKRRRVTTLVNIVVRDEDSVVNFGFWFFFFFGKKNQYERDLEDRCS